MLGGDSLRGAQLLALVRTAFGVELPPDALFADAGTVVGMAHRIEVLRAGAVGVASGRPTIPRRDPGAPVPLSGTQLRAWFLQRLDPRSTAYNEARMWHIHGRLDVDALRVALAAVAARQPMLRTRFVGVDGEPRQVVEPEANPALEVIDLPDVGGELERPLARAVRELAAVPFDLAAAPPIRWTLFELGPGHHALLRVWHHIAGDGLSGALLQDDVSIAYAAAVEGKAAPLPPLDVDYGDFAVWQARPDHPGHALSLAYWKKRLAGLPVLALPTDRRRPPAQSFRGGVVTRTLGDEIAGPLKALARERRRDAVRGLPRRLLGAALAPVRRHRPRDRHAGGGPPGARARAGDRLLREHAGDPRRARRCAFDARARPAHARPRARDARPRRRAVRELVDALAMPRDPSRNPLFQVAFALRERDAVELRLAGTLVRRAPTGVERAKFDLTLSLTDSAEGVAALWEYCADLFARRRSSEWRGSSRRWFAAMAASPDAPVTTLPLAGRGDTSPDASTARRAGTRVPLGDESTRTSPSSPARDRRRRRSVASTTLRSTPRQTASRTNCGRAASARAPFVAVSARRRPRTSRSPGSPC